MNWKNYLFGKNDIRLPENHIQIISNKAMLIDGNYVTYYDVPKKLKIGDAAWFKIQNLVLIHGIVVDKIGQFVAINNEPYVKGFPTSIKLMENNPTRVTLHWEQPDIRPCTMYMNDKNIHTATFLKPKSYGIVVDTIHIPKLHRAKHINPESTEFVSDAFTKICLTRILQNVNITADEAKEQILELFEL